MSGDILKVGDTVLWRGTYGTEPAEPAEVIGIQRDCVDKYGKAVSELPWAQATSRTVIIDLANGHWAYGNQLERIQ